MSHSEPLLIVRQVSKTYKTGSIAVDALRGVDAKRTSHRAEWTGFIFQSFNLTGVAGLLSSYQLLVRSNTFEIKLDFVIPWLALAIIAMLPLSAAALASAIPARRAARIPVAAALRLSD